MSFIRNTIRQAVRLAVFVLLSYSVVGFIDLEIWLINSNPYFNGFDLLALLMSVVAIRVVVRLLPDTKKAK